MTTVPTRVAMVQRHPRPGFHSIETVFRTVACAFPEEIRAELHVSPFPSRGLWNRVRAARAAGRAMRGTRAEVAHVLGDAHYLVFGLPRRRTVLTVHDCDFLTGKRGLRRFLLWLIWLYLPMRFCAVATTISERTRSDLVALSGCDPDHVRVIPNPLPARFRPAPPAAHERPRILHIGTKANKNLPRLIAALAGLDVELTIIGRLTVSHEQQIAQAGLAVRNLVDLSDVALVEAYWACSLVAFVSTSEGFGMPIIEAQATGRPVLTSDILPMSDVAGGAALLVDPLDIEAIRSAVLRLINAPALRDRLIAAGLDYVRRFEPRQVARSYAALYRELAARA